MTDKPKYNAEWRRLSDMPVPKWEPASIVLDNKMYVHGGYETGIISGKNLHVFDPEGSSHGTWEKLQDLPSDISHVNLAPGLTGFCRWNERHGPTSRHKRSYYRRILAF